MDFLDVSFIEETVTTGVESFPDTDVVQNSSWTELQAYNAQPQATSSLQTSSTIPEAGLTEPQASISEPQASSSKQTASARPGSSERNKRPPRVFQCKQCRYFTRSAVNFYRHKKSVHAKVKKKCTTCKKQFSQAYDLYQHMKSAHENIKLVCEWCSKIFNTRFPLRRHIRLMHTGDVKYECKICGKKYLDKNSYFGHINTHMNTKPYDCLVCKKAFAYKNSLQRHTTACGNRDPNKYKCELCDKIFKSSASLKAHTKGVHGNKDKYCQCGKAFSWPSALARHKKSCRVVQ